MSRCVYLWLAALWLPASAMAASVQEVRTESGLIAWLVEEHALPLVSVRLIFRDSGYAYDTVGKYGRANMAAAMLTEGAGELDSTRFHETLEAHAIRLNTGVDEDHLSISLSSISEHKHTAFTLLGSILATPRLDAEAMERARRQTVSLIAQQAENPGYILSRRWHALAFGAHPYNQPALGETADVEKLSKADIQEYLGRYLARDNVVISVVGDITADELRRLLEQALSSLPEKRRADAAIAEVTLAGAATSDVITFDIPQTIITFSANGPKRDDPNYYAAYVLNEWVGGGGLTSRLSKEIREKRGLAYSISSILEPLAHAGGWRGQLATRNDKAGEAVSVVRSTLQALAKQGITDEELWDIKQYLTGSFVLNLDSNEAIAGFLTNMQLNHLGRDYLDKRNNLINAVTREQVNAAAKRLLDPGRLLVVMIGKPTQKPQ